MTDEPEDVEEQVLEAVKEMDAEVEDDGEGCMHRAWGGEEIINIPICPVCHGRDIEEADTRNWRCKTCRQWFLKKGEVLNGKVEKID